MSMPNGPSMQFGDSGPSLGKCPPPPNVSLSSIISPILKTITNPLEGLKALSNLTGNGANPLDKVLESATKLTSLLKGNPKILLDEAFGGAGGKGNHLARPDRGPVR